MHKEAWYKNPWVWLVIFFPLLAVVAGIATVIITSQNQPEMVVDDYYKKGKAINQELTLYNKAEEIGISLQLKSQGELIEVKANQALPAIKLRMIHSTLAELDFAAILTPNANGSLSASLDKEIAGKWEAVLMPMDESWKVRNIVVFPTTDWQTLK